LYDEKKIDEVMSVVRNLVARPYVDSISEEFAGYFNSWGLEIFLTNEAPDREVIELRNDLLVYLNEVLPEGNKLFSWDACFWRTHCKIEVLFPWDKPRDTGDILDKDLTGRSV
jgi:hypothetical protein